MMNLFDKVKVVCALVVMGLELAAYSAAPMVTSVTAQQRYPWNGLVDIVVTFNGAESDVAKANCVFAATNSATKTALAIAHVTKQGNDTGSGTTWTRRFIWDTNADLGEVKIDDLELTVDVDALGGVQLWAGGPYWAECNVGASKPEEYGLYFWWGDTEGHAGDWYFDTAHCPTYGKSISELQSLGYIDSTGNLSPAHDAALAHLGMPWRMPTEAELDALVSNCYTIWTTHNGVNGQLVMGRDAYSSKSIFLPAAGVGCYSSNDELGSRCQYWSSTLNSDSSLYYAFCYGRCMVFGPDFFGSRGSAAGSLGLSVRPLRGFSGSAHSACSTHLSLDNRTGTRVAAATERICFSPAWESATAGATAVVSVNGEVVKSSTDAGVYEWTPPQDGTYELTHAVFVNGVQVGEALTATFVVGAAVLPRSCDWTTGTMELGWFVDAKDLNPITYSVYWSGSDDPASCVGDAGHLVGTKVYSPTGTGVQELTISDDQYLTHGDGLQPIYYHVVGSDGSRSCCITRNRYGLFYGLATYDKSKFPSLTERANRGTSASKFADLMISSGGMVRSNAFTRIDKDATYDNLTKDFAYVTQVTKPGDLLVFFCATHGGRKENGKGVVCLYDDYLANDRLANLLKQVDSDQLGNTKGVAQINVIAACHSGSFFQAEGAAKWFLDRDLAMCSANVGWIASASYDTSSYAFEPYPALQTFLLHYGWDKGWAGSGDYVTFGELGRYAKGMVHDLMYDEIQTEPVMEPEFGGVLDAVRAGKRGSHKVMSKPDKPTLDITQSDSQGNIKLEWIDDQTASGYVLYQHLPFKNYYFSYYPEKSNLVDVHLEDFTSLYLFHLKAFNGAGVTTSDEVSSLKKVVKTIGNLIYKYYEATAGLILYSITTENAWAFAPGKIKIPSSCEGEDVVGIDSSAFDELQGVEEVTLPGTILSLESGTFERCNNLTTIVFEGGLPSGVQDSGILDSVSSVYYPRRFSAQYEAVVPSDLFAGYTDDVGEELAIETEQLPSVMEMVDCEVQLECSGGAEPYSWWMSEDGYRIDTETSSFAEVGEAQGWREDDGWWEYELPFAFNCCGHMFKTVRVDDDANFEFEDDLGRYASIYSGFGDLYSEGIEQDIFVERGQDRVTFRWKRVKYSDRDNTVNYAVTLYSNGVIRCSFGECTDAVRSVEVCGDLIYGAYVEQEGDDDIVLVPNYLPIGLSLDEDGIISGVPEQAGHYDFEVMVQDDEDEICSKRLSIDVAANPNRRPVVTDCEPSWDKAVCLRAGERASVAVAVTDPDGDELSYRWFLDGEEVAGADAASCELTSDMTMRGKHWLTCTVSDGVWSVGTSGWSISIGGELFVNAEDGADALQSALNDAIDGDVIYVGPGTYSPVEVPWLQRVRIVATDGCANTIVDGCHSASCFQVAYNGSNTNNMVRIEGFTLQDGFAEMGGGANGAWLIGCVVRNNAAELSGGGVAYGRADNCLIVGNTAQYGGGTAYVDLYNCTVVGNVAEQYNGGRYGGAEYNSIIWGNESAYDDSNVDDPLFVDADNGDYRLSEGSPCIGMGDNSYVATARDLAGNVRIQRGSVDLGAYESAYSLPRPDAVAWLSVSPRTYAILLDWADATYAKRYKVYRVKDALDDGAAELIATVSDASYEDKSVAYGTDYRYWVVPCNEVGEGERSEPEVGGLLPPLNIVDSQLPDVTSGSGCEFTLRATGGDGCYAWSLPTYDVKIEEQSTFEKVGEPMGWFDDDASWDYKLPFDFPLGEDATSVVEVDDNGYLVLPFESGDMTVCAAWDLDLYANPGDIYVSRTDDAVTFRWERVIFDTDEAVDVSATLYANGCIRLSCAGGTISVDRGLEYRDADYWYGVPGDIVLTPNALPSGLELSDDGVVSGEPTGDGTYRFVVKVEDGNGECMTRKISLNVRGNSVDPIPDIGGSPSAVEVYGALEGSTDSELQVTITDAATYNAYREWALKIGAAEVKASPFAWVSFATDSAALLAKMPTDEDLKVEEFKPSAAAGSFDFTVSVKDITIGDKASVDNLKKLFGLEGAESLAPAAFSSENVALDFKEPQDGKLKFTATPAVDNAKSFFMKAKVK